MAERCDVAIVGGGPAGAATAIGLARRGYDVVVLERHEAAQWRACGVFASPLVRGRLRDLGLSQAEIDALNRPISTLNLQSTRGANCTLEYTRGFACGFDRVALDRRLLDVAAGRGADVRRGVVVRDIKLSARGNQQLAYSSVANEEPVAGTIEARVVVGADGGGSRVARAAGVATQRNWLGRSGITFHVKDPDFAARAGSPSSAGRFVFGYGWYVGLAPVPADRVNVGIVTQTGRLSNGVDRIIDGALGSIPGQSARWKSLPKTDEPHVAGRLEHHTSRAAADGWLLVGDAIEFIDPLTGEGLHRSLVTADLASDAIDRALSGDRNAMSGYDLCVRMRFRSKNVVSLVLQAFLADPRVLDYALRRLDSRTSLRDELTAVLADQARATRVLDPRFMARLLAP